jgi:acyl dehydratase
MEINPDNGLGAESTNRRRAFDDVTVGDSLPPLTVTVTTRQLVMYAGASGDFVPIHYDKDKAAEAGHPKVIVHGALKSALIARMLTDWAGDPAALVELDVSYRGIDYADDPLTCRAKVTAKRDQSPLPLRDGVPATAGHRERGQESPLSSEGDSPRLAHSAPSPSGARSRAQEVQERGRFIPSPSMGEGKGEGEGPVILSKAKDPAGLLAAGQGAGATYGLIEFEVSLENSQGQVTTPGRAVVRLWHNLLPLAGGSPGQR